MIRLGFDFLSIASGLRLRHYGVLQKPEVRLTCPRELGGREVVIDELYIEAAERGMGVGAEILGRLKEHMRAHNVVAIQLEVDWRNERARCLVPAFDGVVYSIEWKDALWARFYTAAPQRRRQSVEQYSIVKRA